MRVPTPQLAATIERRLLINYRVDPGVAQSLLPDSLRPQLVDGSAVAGICLIRLGAVRPTWIRPEIGWSAENAAHRIAVEWDDESGTHAGVYIPERHSASWLPVAAGGRLFPGVHRHAQFTGSETDNRVQVAMTAAQTSVLADVEITDSWSSSLFDTLADASAFFQNGAVGWSPSHDGRTLEGLQLATTQWRVEAGRPVTVDSSFFSALPAGSAALDSVLVMRNVPVEWRAPEAAPATAPAQAPPGGSSKKLTRSER